MPKILIVDDNEIIRRLLALTIARFGYDYAVSDNAETAKTFLQTDSFDLVLCDVNMPGESGIDLTRYIDRNYEDLAVIMVTSVDDPALAETAMQAGAYGYIIKPFNPSELIINVRNALRRRQLEIEHRLHRLFLEEKVLERTGKLEKALEGIVHAMSLTVEKRDPYTAGHQRRVAILAGAIAAEMGIPDEQIEGIRLAGMIHDLGKISVPAEILSKPTRLTPIEFILFQTHPQIGHDIMRDIDFPWPIAQMILEHHERWDGSGYPQGLRDVSILLEARILAVADVVEAMATHRPYRPALGVEKALEEIANHRGGLYDPDAVDSCLHLFQEKQFSLGPAF